MVIFLKKGQTESLSFLVGLFLTIIFVTVAVYFLSLFWIEPDCFSLLQKGVKGAIDNPGETVEFECGFEKPTAVFGKDDKYAFKFYPSELPLPPNTLIFKPELDMCKDKSCVCECGNLKSTGQLRLDSSETDCLNPKCVSFDKNIISSCELVKNIEAEVLTPRGRFISKFPNYINCPFGLGGVFLAQGGMVSQEGILGRGFKLPTVEEDRINSIPVKIMFNQEFDIVEANFGEKFYPFDLTIIAQIYSRLLENLKDGLDKNLEIGINQDQILNRFALNGNGVLRYLYDEKGKNTGEIAYNIVLLIDKEKMSLIIPFSVFSEGRLVYFNSKTLSSNNLVSSCLNGKEYNYLLVTFGDIFGLKTYGVYGLSDNPFKEEKFIDYKFFNYNYKEKSVDIKTAFYNSLFKSVYPAFYNSLYTEAYPHLLENLNLYSDDLVFRRDPNNPDKLCLFEKGFKEPENDITENG